EPEPQLEAPEPEPQLESPKPPEDRDVIFVGTKPIMTYVSATLTQLSTRQTVTIKARGKRITQAVDVSQMIVKRMDSVGYVVSDVRISSDSLTSQDGKQRNVSTMEIDISKS
ncbi:MAG: DNA-binding protein, partial [Nitrosopumilus sp.]